jgi:RimJ/RimL family protein N-acetyltransferase
MSVELTREQFESALPLFEAFPYDPASVQATLEDPKARLFADKALAPEAALICPQSRDGISLIAGNANLACSLTQFVLSIAEEPPQVRFLSLPSDEWRYRLLPALSDCLYEKPRVSFTLTHPQRSQGWRERMPVGFTMQRIDRRLAEWIPQEVSQWFGGYWRDIEQFLAQGIGFCLLQDSRIVSLAYSAYPVSQLLEVVVETERKSWGRGFAPLCCAALVEYCLVHKVAPQWGADADHRESISVARKVGFGNERFHWWLGRRL